MANDGQIVIGAGIDLDTFDKNLATMNRDIAKTSENKIVIEPSTKGIREAEKELDGLNKELDKQQQELDELEAAWRSFTENGANITEFTEGVDREFQQAAAAFEEGTEKAYELEQAIESAKNTMASTKETERLAKETDKLAQEQEKAARTTQAMEAALLAMATQVISKAVSAMDDLITSTMSFRREMAMLENNLALSGGSIEQAEQAMRSYAGIVDDVGQSASAASSLIAAGFDGNALEQALDSVGGAFISLGYNVETLSNDIRRTFGENEAVGQFKQLLEGAGVGVEGFNRQMASASTEAQKQQAIIEALNSVRTQEGASLQQVAQAYRAANPDLVDAGLATQDMATAQAKLAEALQPAKTALDEAKASALGLVAGFAEANPEVATFAYLFVNIGGTVLAAAVGIAALMKILGPLGSTAKTALGAVSSSAGAASTGIEQVGSASKTSAASTLAFGAAVLMIGAGIAVAVMALNEFAQTLDQADTSAIELAVGVGIVTVALTGGIAMIAAVGATATATAPQLIAFGLAIAAIALSVGYLVSALADLVKAINGVPDINIGTNNGTVNVGYATGTQSARRGWARVGENGPELVNFGGGEQVLNASQTAAKQSMMGGARTTNNSYYLSMPVEAGKISEVSNLLDIANNFGTSMRQGYTGE